MTTAPLDPRMAQMQHSAQDTQDSARRIDTLKKNLTPPKDKEKKLREACQGFESIFIQKMWEQMRAAVPKSGLLKGREEQFWQGMFDQELSKKMSSAGGIGLADMMYDQLSRNLLSATRTTASGLARKDDGFAVSPAPLLPRASSGGVQATADARSANMAQTTATAQNIYSGEAVQPEADGVAEQHPAGNPAGGPATTASGNTPRPTGPQPTGQPDAAEQTPPSTSPIVEQFLAELRARQGVAPQASPSQPLAAGQPAVMPGAPQGMPTPVASAQNAMQTADSRLPAGGVMPPMPAMQRRPRVERHQGPSTGPQPTAAVPTAPGSTAASIAGTPFAPRAAATPAVTPPSATGPSPSPAVAQAPIPQGQPAQTAPESVATPQIVHNTFTTNVPPTRGARRRPPRVPRGQALNRMPTQPAAPQQTPPAQQAQQSQPPQTTAARQPAVATPATTQTASATPGGSVPQG